MHEIVKAESGHRKEGTMETDKNNLRVTSAFKELYRKLIMELTGEILLIRSGAWFPAAGKHLPQKPL